MGLQKIQAQVELTGRESIHLEVSVDAQFVIQKASLSGIGDLELLQMLQKWRAHLKGPLSEVPLPEGSSTAAMLLREVILKAKGQWEYPYAQKELCHCRAVPTEKVDMAVLCGAHTPEKVSRQTSASTGCGTCRPDVEEIIAYRLNPQLCKKKAAA